MKWESHWQCGERRNRTVLYVVKSCATAGLIFREVSWEGSQSYWLSFGPDKQNNHYGRNKTTIMWQNQQAHPIKRITRSTGKHDIPLREEFSISVHPRSVTTAHSFISARCSSTALIYKNCSVVQGGANFSEVFQNLFAFALSESQISTQSQEMEITGVETTAKTLQTLIKWA